jgi:hypothetical protein
MARIGVGATAVLLLGLLVYGCGGEPATTTLLQGDVSSTATEDISTTATEPVATTSVSDTASPADDSGEPTIPADFPVPICGFPSGPCEGGTVYSAFPTEVIVIYPEAEFEALVDYYETVSDANGGTQFELFPEGFEWQIPGTAVTFSITVAPVDPDFRPNLPDGIQLYVTFLP